MNKSNYTKEELKNIKQDKIAYINNYIDLDTIFIECVGRSRSGSNDYFRVYALENNDRIIKDITIAVYFITTFRYNDTLDALSVDGGGYSKSGYILESIKYNLK